MASYNRGEVVTTRVEYRLRSPAPIGEVYRAANAALVEQGIDLAGDLPHDTVLWVTSTDEEIVIYFDKEVRRG